MKYTKISPFTLGFVHTILTNGMFVAITYLSFKDCQQGDCAVRESPLIIGVSFGSILFIYGLIKLIFYRDDYGSGLLLGSILTLPFLVIPTMIFIFNLG